MAANRFRWVASGLNTFGASLPIDVGLEAQPLFCHNSRHKRTKMFEMHEAEIHTR